MVRLREAMQGVVLWKTMSPCGSYTRTSAPAGFELILTSCLGPQIIEAQPVRRVIRAQEPRSVTIDLLSFIFDFQMTNEERLNFSTGSCICASYPPAPTRILQQFV